MVCMVTLFSQSFLFLSMKSNTLASITLMLFSLFIVADFCVRVYLPLSPIRQEIESSLTYQNDEVLHYMNHIVRGSVF